MNTRAVSRRDSERKDAFRRQKQIDSLYSQAELALLASAVCGAILVAIMHTESSATNLITWATAMMAVALSRYFLIRVYNSQNLQYTDLSRWRYAFIATLFASGAAWGTASYFVAPSVAVADQAIVIIFICGFVAACVAAFSVDRLAFASFALPALGIPICILLISGFSESRAFAGVLSLFGCFLFASAFRAAKSQLADFDTQFEKQELAHTLAQEKHKISALADELEERVALRTEELLQINLQLNKRIEEKLEAERRTQIQVQRFRGVFEQAPIGMMIVHAASGKVASANTKACELLGYQSQELDDMLAEKLLCPSERRKNADASVFCIEGGSERRLLHRRGFVLWGRMSVGMLADSDQEDPHYVIQIEDLSELKQARTDLSERSGALEVAFQSSPSGAAIIDGSGRIIVVNRSLEDILTRDGISLEGRSLTSILEANDEQNNSAVLARLFGGDIDRVEFEHTIFRHTATQKRVLVRISRVNEHSDASKFAVVHMTQLSDARFGESQLPLADNLIVLRNTNNR